MRGQVHLDVREREADEHNPVNQSLVVKEEIILHTALSLSINRSLLTGCDVPGTVLGRNRKCTVCR